MDSGIIPLLWGAVLLFIASPFDDLLIFALIIWLFK